MNLQKADSNSQKKIDKIKDEKIKESAKKAMSIDEKTQKEDSKELNNLIDELTK